MACSDLKTSFISVGKCDIFPEGSHVCHPDAKGNFACPKILKPVCGYPDRTVRCYEGCWFDFANECIGCASPNILYL
jgi:hypothetical protein